MDRFQYVNILSNNLFSSLKTLNLESFVFQQDNDPKHTSNHAKQFFGGKNIALLPWPSQSPDLNPIEHVWAYIEQKMGGRIFKNKNLLKDAIIEIWKEIPKNIIQNIVRSMKKLFFAVIKAKGGHTKY